MKRILVTGATGNIGLELIRFVYKINTQTRIIAGVKHVEKAGKLNLPVMKTRISQL